MQLSYRKNNLMIFNRKQDTCSSSTGRIIPITILPEIENIQLSYMKEIPPAFLQEENYMQLSYRKKNTCCSSIERRISAALPQEEQYLQLFHSKKNTGNSST